MSNAKRRRSISAFSTTAALLTLAGCTPYTPAPLTEVNLMNPDEAVAQILPLADAVGREVGEGWEPDGTLTPGTVGQAGAPCTLPNGEEGVNFALAWMGPGVQDIDGAAARVQAAWKELGTEVQIAVETSMGVQTRVLADPPYLTGTYADGYFVRVGISQDGTTMQTITHCILDPDTRE